MGSYRVTAPLVQVETTARNFVQVAKGGELPGNITKEALKNVLDLGYAEKVPTDAPAVASPAPTRVAPSNVKDILEAVGDDVEKAKAALAAEYESKADKARSSLVEPLEAIINAATTSGDGSGS